MTAWSMLLPITKPLGYGKVGWVLKNYSFKVWGIKLGMANLLGFGTHHGRLLQLTSNLNHQDRKDALRTGFLSSCMKEGKLGIMIWFSAYSTRKMRKQLSKFLSARWDFMTSWFGTILLLVDILWIQATINNLRCGIISPSIEPKSSRNREEEQAMWRRL